MTDRIRLALIGCGAVARILHLPAIAGVQEVELAALVDPCLERAAELAMKYGARRIAAEYQELIDGIDAAIVATPNNLHAPIAIDLLARGVHVLVEKPMALNARDGEKMIAAAQESGRVLAVGMEMRFFDPSRFVKAALSGSLLGPIHKFDLRVGIVSTWPAATDYFLRAHQAGGGVLINHGIHVLDLLLWWLGDYAEVSYFDDALGGVEANGELRLRFRNGAAGTVEISRMRKLRNTCFLEGERGALEIELWEPDGRLYLQQGDHLVLHGHTAAPEFTHTEAPEIFRRQLEDFVAAIRDRRAPFVTGSEALRAVRLIQACYASRRSLEVPWMTAEWPQNGDRRVA